MKEVENDDVDGKDSGIDDSDDDDNDKDYDDGDGDDDHGDDYGGWYDDSDYDNSKGIKCKLFDRKTNLHIGLLRWSMKNIKTYTVDGLKAHITHFLFTIMS